MTVEALRDRLALKPLCEADTARTVTGGYAGDLLSWVMGRAQADAVWVTIMSNVNVAAVAALADVAMVILAEDVSPDAELLDAARARGVNLYQSPQPAFSLCGALTGLLS